MSSEVRLIPDWREKWEPVTTHTKPMQVLEVWEDKGGIAAIVNNEGRIFVCYGWLALKPTPKKLRPWKREEVPVGSVVRHKNGKTVAMIDCVDGTEIYVSTTSTGWITPENLLLGYVIHATSAMAPGFPPNNAPSVGWRSDWL